MPKKDKLIEKLYKNQIEKVKKFLEEIGEK